MLTYYGTPIDGTARHGADEETTASSRTSGRCTSGSRPRFSTSSTTCRRIRWCRSQGLRACRQLLAYLLREIGIQRQRLLDGQPVDDTMLTRLVQFQMGRSTPTVQRPADLDPRLVSDLRIAENVMGTIVGAIAGQEEATCRVIDSLIRLQEGEYRTSGPARYRYGSFAEATQLALNVLSGTNASQRAAPSCTSTSSKRCGCSRKAKCCCASARATGHESPTAGRSPRARSSSRRTGRR